MQEKRQDQRDFSLLHIKIDSLAKIMIVQLKIIPEIRDSVTIEITKQALSAFAANKFNFF